MATCCTPDITPFLNVSTTVIPYTGTRPTVTVAYLQPDGTLLFNGVFTQIDIIGGVVTVDHGGPQSGYVTLLQ